MNIEKIPFPEIKTKIPKFEKILIVNHFVEHAAFKKWNKKYSQIYGKKHVGLQLFLHCSILYFIGWSLYLKILGKEDGMEIKSLIDQIHTYNEESFSNATVYENFIDLLNDEEMIQYQETVYDLVPKNLKDISKYLDELVEYLLSKQIRHNSGEFYTPSFLVKKMIDTSYLFGERVVDPSCGTGNFLIEVVHKIFESDRTEEEKKRALEKIYGMDINPISLLLARVNILSASKEYSVDLKANLINVDSLFIESNYFEDQFDLVIGNPPWYTLRDISSFPYQQKIKELAEELEIKPRPKNILNIEISSLFFYQSQKVLMRNGSKIFFLLPRGVMTGSHASRFRNFNGFKNVKIWSFDDSVLNTFNIDFICLYAEKSTNFNPSRDFEIPENVLKLKKVPGKHSQKSKKLVLKEQRILVPYSRIVKNNKTYVQKFIPKIKYNKLIEFKESPYKKLFHKGADLNPRNLIFVEVEDGTGSTVIINPDERIFKRAKAPWNERIYENRIVSERYIFNAVKSTELVSFNLYDHYSVFLPLNKKDLAFDFSSLDQESRSFYNFINGYYLNTKKKSTKKASLIENLNHWQKLITPRQLSLIKVVYNNSGSILTSAVIKGEYLVTGDLSFFETKDIQEAYYLSAILNSRLMNAQIKIKKSSRHIFKIPFDIPIPLFDKDVKLHCNIAELGKKAHQRTKKIVSMSFQRTPEIFKLKLQKIIEKRLNSIFIEIDEKLSLLFGL